MSTQPGPIDQGQEFHTSTERLITADDVAGILGVSPKWVRDHATRRNPRLPYIAVGRLLRFRLSDVQRFIDKLRRDGNSGPGGQTLPIPTAVDDPAQRSPKF